jgi:protein SCO1/2
MKNTSPILKFSVIIGLLAVPTLIFYLFVFTGVHHVSRLPFYGPRQIVEKTERWKLVKDTVYHEVVNYEAILPDSSLFQISSTNGIIYLTHFLDFSVLDGIPKEATYMISEALVEHPDIQAITHIYNYQGEPLPKPSAITSKLAGKDSVWHYVLIPDSLTSYIQQQYFATGENETPQDPFSLVMVDKEKRVRGYYNPVLAADVKRLKQEISYLKREYELNFKTHRYFKYNEKIEQKRK